MLSDLSDEQRQAWDEGRAAAAKMFPMIHQEGFEEGWAACMNMIFRKLRERAAKDRLARDLLVELLD